VGVYTKSKTSELSPLRRKLLRAAAAVADILTVCFVNIEFLERIKLILNQVLISSK
jgi:hypothetical protein